MFFRASTFSCLGRKYFSSAFYRVAMASSNSEAPSGATPVIHGNRRMALSIRSYRYHRIHFTTLQFFSLCKIPFDFRVKKVGVLPTHIKALLYTVFSAMHTLRNLYQSQASLLTEQHNVRQCRSGGQGKAALQVFPPLGGAQAELGPGGLHPPQQRCPWVACLLGPGPEDGFGYIVPPLPQPDRVRGDGCHRQLHFCRQLPGKTSLPGQPLLPFLCQPGQQVFPFLELGPVQGFLDGPRVIEQKNSPSRCGQPRLSGWKGRGWYTPLRHRSHKARGPGTSSPHPGQE